MVADGKEIEEQLVGGRAQHVDGQE